MKERGWQSKKAQWKYSKKRKKDKRLKY